MSLEDVLSKRFYKSSERLAFDVCDFGPCLKVENNGVKIFFDRQKLNLRYLEINIGEDDEIEKLSVKFDNFQKIGGRYNFLKT